MAPSSRDLVMIAALKDLVLNECGTRPPIVTQWIQSKIKQLEEKNAVPKKTSA